jgi:hypothetical protein
MSGFRPVARRAGLLGVVLTTGLAALVSVGQTESDRCSLPVHHAGVVFPLDQVEVAWACRLEPIVTHYTTANKVGPQRTPLPHPVFLYLLDHPVMAAMLVNRLDLGLYKAEQREQGGILGYRRGRHGRDRPSPVSGSCDADLLRGRKP